MNYRKEDLRERCLALTDGKGVDVVFDPAMNAASFRQLFAWYERGLLHPDIGNRYACDALPDALREMHAGRVPGKSVVAFNAPMS
ncbi:MAG: zinc-binding dehydrogenase [Halioglobus sp.]|nr:zinc-binding dehydrogenase [Halioglobus sp.]